jgi:hypothetical protein
MAPITVLIRAEKWQRHGFKLVYDFDFIVYVSSTYFDPAPLGEVAGPRFGRTPFALRLSSTQICTVQLQERHAEWAKQLKNMPPAELSKTMADRQPQHTIQLPFSVAAVASATAATTEAAAAASWVLLPLGFHLDFIFGFYLYGLYKVPLGFDVSSTWV